MLVVGVGMSDFLQKQKYNLISPAQQMLEDTE